MATPLSAASAYQNQLKMMQGVTPSPEETSAGPGFMDMLKQFGQDAVNTEHKAEQTQLSALSGGKVDLTSLVSAVTDAELTLNTVVAVRDRVINAYQDIIRMAI